MAGKQLSGMRVNYAGGPFAEGAIEGGPLHLFETWLHDVSALGIAEPNAMAVATASADAAPSVRTVLLKDISKAGAVFYTNYTSRKGRELDENPYVAAVMLWHEVGRQVRFEGPVSKLSARQSDEYFLTRPRGSRISAIASPQSQPVADRAELEQRWEAARAAADQRPSDWGGYLIEIHRWEFWQGGADRLHDRLQFDLVDDQWQHCRLAP